MAARWRCRSKSGPARSRPIRPLTPSARINAAFFIACRPFEMIGGDRPASIQVAPHPCIGAAHRLQSTHIRVGEALRRVRIVTVPTKDFPFWPACRPKPARRPTAQFLPTCDAGHASTERPFLARAAVRAIALERQDCPSPSLSYSAFPMNASRVSNVLIIRP